MVIVVSAGITDTGRKRSGNEDAMLLDDKHGLYIVADGMGGHLAGEVASRLVVETIKGHMEGGYDDAEQPVGFDETLSREANRLLFGTQLANRTVRHSSTTDESCRGMGSTVSAVYLADDTLIAANVGDSPIYLINDGAIELLSVIHTVTAEQEAVNPEGAKRFGKQYRHVLTRAMGTEETVNADICEVQLFKGNIVVIGSDGLTDRVQPEEIRDIVVKYEPARACQVLVDLANERGGDDNITVIVVKVKEIKPKKGTISALLSRIIGGMGAK